MPASVVMEEIETILNRQINYSDREAAEKKMNDCLNILGKAAKNVANCKGNLERKRASTYKNNSELNSRLLKMKIDSESFKEQEELELAEHLWRGLNKAIDGLKSLLSIQEKSEPTWH